MSYDIVKIALVFISAFSAIVFSSINTVTQQVEYPTILPANVLSSTIATSITPSPTLNPTVEPTSTPTLVLPTSPGTQTSIPNAVSTNSSTDWPTFYLELAKFVIWLIVAFTGAYIFRKRLQMFIRHLSNSQYQSPDNIVQSTASHHPLTLSKLIDHVYNELLIEPKDGRYPLFVIDELEIETSVTFSTSVQEDNKISIQVIELGDSQNRDNENTNRVRIRFSPIVDKNDLKEMLGKDAVLKKHSD